ncbi:c-type cytochrome biogenesis protein CcsB [Jonesia denitrificans]|uniref:Cytochrome c-type biogenesis protein CcsB n=1 Tax=Jonesia denitrificans (strain ATCC 14870 / DSM 20603 / BCRC 15368 / CIP 55.134 / JCM 11481 / NBRC 15587 / NCTC 10816 / Prevot 55134) TaxID=471856 RepID=C7R0N1_JONDD|nr:c-type cytochrome biogenesis protein CcsB [Jonesia denitrificans]ACV08188.1 cytochrome c-type biogenesis protein CcsB [Jonesia denitrificans DSM 20603]ASE08139.1 c-type cytochrome biogenesis protein CcsB [Jonesia denitrificans]QXB42743.1 c-type cytochrome biogenesis protein CcsB [Jonesia denitrificans]SQH20169.1 ABC-type uncharacterized transport system, permease component [Jonesia denitrificans]
MNLSELSDYFVWGTVSAYTLAMVAFAIDLAKVAENVRSDERPTYVGRSTRALGIAMALTTVGVLFHLVAAIVRGFAAGRVPWANMYEFTLTGTLAAVGVFLVVNLWKEIRFLGVFVTVLAITFLMVGLQAFHIDADGVEPALQSYWIVIHVGIAVLATGLFTVAFIISVLQLMRAAWNRATEAGNTPRWAWRAVLPAPDRLEALSFRLNAVAFVMWTFTIIGGAVWANDAWGRAWNWDPKEVWSFIVWVIYAAYLHARATRGWDGQRAAWFVVVGYAAVLFNFTGVNILFDGLHSYAQLPQ